MELWVVLFFTYSLPFFLHVFGLYMVHKRSKNISACQKIYVINLSITELILSFCGALYPILRHQYGHSDVFYQMMILFYLAASCTYFLIMIILTADRFGQVYLNIRYPLYWTTTYAKYAMLAVWISSLSLILVFMSYLLFVAKNRVNIIEGICYTFIYPSLGVVSAIVIVVTYVYIIKKMKKVKTVYAKSPMQSSTTINNTKGVFVVQGVEKSTPRKDNYALLPMLLVLIFVFFIEIPDFVQFLAHVGFIRNTKTLKAACNLTYAVGYILDAVVYVLLSTSCKSWLKRTVESCFNL